MILQFIFQSAALSVMHVGMAAGFAASMGSENAAATGLTSFAVGVPALLAGACVGEAITDEADSENAYSKGAMIGGIVGYAAGSVIGFALKYY